MDFTKPISTGNPRPIGTKEELDTLLFGSTPALLRERAQMQAVIHEANDSTTFSVRRKPA